MTPPTREQLAQLGRDALEQARAQREAVEDLASALRECAEAVREMTRELERVRMDEELDERREPWEGAPEA